MPDSVPRPNVVSVLCQFFHKLVLVGRQLDVVKVEGGGLVAVGHHIAAERTNSRSELVDKFKYERKCIRRRTSWAA